MVSTEVDLSLGTTHAVYYMQIYIQSNVLIKMIYLLENIETLNVIMESVRNQSQDLRSLLRNLNINKNKNHLYSVFSKKCIKPWN